jgi:hypothetical protein
MKIEIQATNDESFSLVNPEQEVTETTNVEPEINIASAETVEEVNSIANKVPRAAPIENNKGAGWFSGTSWG